jgi:hypothetical protein
MFSRPSAWLAGGLLLVLILEVLVNALIKDIPAAQLAILHEIETTTMVLLGIAVRDVFHGDNK